MITNASAIPLCVNVKIASEIELPVTYFNTRVAYVPDTRAHTYGTERSWSLKLTQTLDTIDRGTKIRKKTEIDKATVFALIKTAATT